VQEALHHRRVHVVLAAGGGAVPQAGGHLLDRGQNRRPRLLGRLRRPRRRQQRRRLHGPRPGAEVLGREVLPHALPHVGVHVPGADGPRRSLLVVVLEQLVAGDVPTLADDAGQAGVLHLDGVRHPALPLEAEAELGSHHPHVLVAQRGEPVRLVLLHVGGVADADEGGLQQTHHRGQHLLPRQPGEREIASRALAQRHERDPEAEKALVLGLVSEGHPVRVVAVLLAPLGVAPGRLQMPLGVGTDPDVRPGGRDGQARHPLEHGAVPDLAPARIEHGGPAPEHAPGQTGAAPRHVAQAARLGGGLGIEGERPGSGQGDSR